MNDPVKVAKNVQLLINQKAEITDEMIDAKKQERAAFKEKWEVKASSAYSGPSLTGKKGWEEEAIKLGLAEKTVKTNRWGQKQPEETAFKLSAIEEKSKALGRQISYGKVQLESLAMGGNYAGMSARGRKGKKEAKRQFGSTWGSTMDSESAMQNKLFQLKTWGVDISKVAPNLVLKQSVEKREDGRRILHRGVAGGFSGKDRAAVASLYEKMVLERAGVVEGGTSKILKKTATTVPKDPRLSRKPAGTQTGSKTSSISGVAPTSYVDRSGQPIKEAMVERLQGGGTLTHPITREIIPKTVRLTPEYLKFFSKPVATTRSLMSRAVRSADKKYLRALKSGKATYTAVTAPATTGEVAPKTTARQRQKARRQDKIRTKATPIAAKQLALEQQKLKEVTEKYGIDSTEHREQRGITNLANRKMEAALYGMDYDREKERSEKWDKGTKFKALFGSGARGGYNVDEEGKRIWQEGTTHGILATQNKIAALQRAGVDVSEFKGKEMLSVAKKVDVLFKEKVVAPALAAAGGVGAGVKPTPDLAPSALPSVDSIIPKTMAKKAPTVKLSENAVRVAVPMTTKGLTASVPANTQSIAARVKENQSMKKSIALLAERDKLFNNAEDSSMMHPEDAAKWEKMSAQAGDLMREAEASYYKRTGLTPPVVPMPKGAKSSDWESRPQRTGKQIRTSQTELANAQQGASGIGKGDVSIGPTVRSNIDNSKHDTYTVGKSSVTPDRRMLRYAGSIDF
jgi:hypothetical protein